MFKVRFKNIIMSCVAVALLASCHSHTKVVKVDDKRDPGTVHEEVYIIDIGSSRGRVIEEANTWLGTPYKYGGAEKGVCTDCSGMVMSVYLSAVNIKLPRRSADISDFCKPLKAKDVEQADLVFFATGSDSTQVSHVGIMIDTERFIHASSSKGVVISHLSNSYYAKRLLNYGRVPGM